MKVTNKTLGELYETFLTEMKNTKLKINEPQMAKFQKVVKFFKNYIDEFGGEVIDFDYTPAEIHGGLTVAFDVFDTYDERLEEFGDVIKCCSAFGMDVTDGKVCISLTVPDIYKIM